MEVLCLKYQALRVENISVQFVKERLKGEKMVDSERNVVFHKNEDSYNKEVALTGINFSIYLKSNLDCDTLESMTDLGIMKLKEIKKMEEK